MSFASAVKMELCRSATENGCCKKAECCGLLLFGKSFSRADVTLTTGIQAVARRAAQLAAEETGAIMEVSSAMLHRGDSRVVFTLSAADQNARDAVLAAFGYTGREINLRINRSNMENDCCVGAFLRGAFLSCGTVSDPQKDYHLEFPVPFMNLARDLCALIGEIYELGFQPGMLQRRGAYVVYLKGSERIADFLTFMGAGNAAMELMQTKIVKEVRNNVNRKINFETANLGKTAQAAAAQVLAIEKILASPRGIHALPEDLQELAMLRYRSPEMSLRELGDTLSEPLSRSGINHRLQRIVDFSKEI